MPEIIQDTALNASKQTEIRAMRSCVTSIFREGRSEKPFAIVIANTHFADLRPASWPPSDRSEWCRPGSFATTTTRPRTTAQRTFGTFASRD
jgi:hypothetical protein